MNKHCSPERSLRFSSGFTLVELLVVISIISILAGTMFVVINPVQLQRKSREAVLKAKTSQLCLALNSCGAAKDDARICDNSGGADPFSDLGVVNPAGNPATATYTITGPVAAATATVQIVGSLTTAGSTCQYRCSINFNDGSIGKFEQVPATDCL